VFRFRAEKGGGIILGLIFRMKFMNWRLSRLLSFLDGWVLAPKLHCQANHKNGVDALEDKRDL
jgi:hypothetical protein